jgi:DNA polymerase-3 subunit gamma/tau
MDAASNNSVDDIRELRENVALAPMGGGRRVYILDEAHMLSTQAWNAFLKTLEEPPAHVVFVLATTEAHKVPATIVDRCHRFDFHRPSLQQISGVLRKVAAEEEIEIPDPAVTMIARSATGSFRDALGTLEQLVTYGGPQVKLEEVLEVLGVADAETVLDAAESLADHDPKAALMAVEKLSASGRDLTQFMRELAAHLRHLFVVQTLGDVPESFAVTADQTDRLQSQAERISQAEVLRAIDLLAAALTAVKDGSDSRIQLEIALLKATQPQSDGSLQALAARVERLEQSQSGGNSAPPRPAPTKPPEVAPQPERQSEPEPPAPPRAAASPPERAAQRAEAAAVAAVADTEVEPTMDLDQLKSLWPAVVEAVCEENQMVGASLANGRPSALEGSRLTVAFGEESAFAKKTVERKRDLPAKAIRTLTGHPFEIAYEVRDGESVTADGISEDELLERLRQDFGATEVLDSEE